MPSWFLLTEMSAWLWIWFELKVRGRSGGGMVLDRRWSTQVCTGLNDSLPYPQYRIVPFGCYAFTPYLSWDISCMYTQSLSQSPAPVNRNGAIYRVGQLCTGLFNPSGLLWTPLISCIHAPILKPFNVLIAHKVRFVLVYHKPWKVKN